MEEQQLHKQPDIQTTARERRRLYLLLLEGGRVDQVRRWNFCRSNNSVHSFFCRRSLENGLTLYIVTWLAATLLQQREGGGCLFMPARCTTLHRERDRERELACHTQQIRTFVSISLSTKKSSSSPPLLTFLESCSRKECCCCCRCRVNAIVCYWTFCFPLCLCLPHQQRNLPSE